MAEAPFDLPRAQKWFAIECNNAAWDLLDKPERTTDETERLLHVAHASLHHWLAAGNELNHLRGVVLLANVYAGAGLPDGARLFADKALVLSAAAGDTQTTFDRATTLAAVARAYSVSGDGARAKEFFDLAQQAAAKLDADERPVFDQLCPKL